MAYLKSYLARVGAGLQLLLVIIASLAVAAVYIAFLCLFFFPVALSWWLWPWGVVFLLLQGPLLLLFWPLIGDVGKVLSILLDKMWGPPDDEQPSPNDAHPFPYATRQAYLQAYPARARYVGLCVWYVMARPLSYLGLVLVYVIWVLPPGAAVITIMSMHSDAVWQGVLYSILVAALWSVFSVPLALDAEKALKNLRETSRMRYYMLTPPST